MAFFDFLKPASGATMEDIRRENQEADPGRVLYQTAFGGLERLQREQTARFQAARAPQEAAVAALGQRAATLEGGAALQGVQQARERAQAQAMQAPQAILGGQIGTAAASQFGTLEQEAAARQAAYIRGIGGLGEAVSAEAEERRKLEQAMLQDLQARYAAAMQQAAYGREREARERQAAYGNVATVAGAALGMALGGPKGAMAGAKAGGGMG